MSKTKPDSPAAGKPGRKAPRLDQPRAFRIANRTYRNWGFVAVSETGESGQYSTAQAALNAYYPATRVEATWYGDGEDTREFVCTINRAAGVIEYKPTAAAAPARDLTYGEAVNIAAAMDSPGTLVIDESAPAPDMTAMPEGGEPGQPI